MYFKIVSGLKVKGITKHLPTVFSGNIIFARPHNETAAFGLTTPDISFDLGSNKIHIVLEPSQ